MMMRSFLLLSALLSLSYANFDGSRNMRVVKRVVWDDQGHHHSVDLPRNSHHRVLQEGEETQQQQTEGEDDEDIEIEVSVPEPFLGDDSPSAPVPIVPVPTPPPHEHNETTSPTPAPTHDDDGNHTDAPTPTPAPSTLAPTHHNVTDPPTHAPTTMAPTIVQPAAHHGISFFRLMGKMMAWCILLGLGVLLYGFCIQHKYQIAYYARHLGHCLVGVHQWLLEKIRPSHNLHSGYAAMYASERNDAQAALLFDAPQSISLFGNSGGYDDPNYGDQGFVMGQHSNLNFQSMG